MLGTKNFSLTVSRARQNARISHYSMFSRLRSYHEYLLRRGAWKRILSILGSGQSKGSRQNRYVSRSRHPVMADQLSKKSVIYQGDRDRYIGMSDALLTSNVKVVVGASEALNQPFSA